MRPSAARPARRPRTARVLCVAGLLATGLLAGATPAAAHPGIALDPTLPTDLTYSATDNVEYLGRFPEHTGTAGGIQKDDGVFLITDPRGVYAYDTTDPANPVLLDALPLYQTATATGAALAQEDPDTNGSILLVDGATSPAATTAQLQVVDVSDPRDLKVLGTVAASDHTWTCVSSGDNGCAYAYGRTGAVVRLTDPSKPVLLPTTWRQYVGLGAARALGNSPYTHDLTEVRPGVVMSAGAKNVLMDTRNPEQPVLLNTLDESKRFPSLGYHSVEWARGGTDRWLVMGTEIAPSGALNTAGSDCNGTESVIETWDAAQVRDRLQAYLDAPAAIRAAALVALRAARFTKVDSYSVNGRGLFLDGAAPGHVLYCAHWMEEHPDFADGGLLAVSYYDRGTRFLRVGSDGKMTEQGWLTAAEGYSGSVQWVSDDVAYVMDYRRGLELVRLLPGAATGLRRGAGDVVALGSLRLTADEEAGTPAALPVAGGLLALLVLNVSVLRRRRTVDGATSA